MRRVGISGPEVLRDHRCDRVGGFLNQEVPAARQQPERRRRHRVVQPLAQGSEARSGRPRPRGSAPAHRCGERCRAPRSAASGTRSSPSSDPREPRGPSAVRVGRRTSPVRVERDDRARALLDLDRLTDELANHPARSRVRSRRPYAHQRDPGDGASPIMNVPTSTNGATRGRRRPRGEGAAPPLRRSRERRRRTARTPRCARAHGRGNAESTTSSVAAVTGVESRRPPRSGATTRNAYPPSRGTKSRHCHDDVGKPCSSSTGAPSPSSWNAINARRRGTVFGATLRSSRTLLPERRRMHASTMWSPRDGVDDPTTRAIRPHVMHPHHIDAVRGAPRDDAGGPVHPLGRIVDPRELADEPLARCADEHRRTAAARTTRSRGATRGRGRGPCRTRGPGRRTRGHDRTPAATAAPTRAARKSRTSVTTSP